jgi:hypothetical protein
MSLRFGSVEAAAGPARVRLATGAMERAAAAMTREASKRVVQQTTRFMRVCAFLRTGHAFEWDSPLYLPYCPRAIPRCQSPVDWIDRVCEWHTMHGGHRAPLAHDFSPGDQS